MTKRRRKFWDFINIPIVMMCVGVLLLLGAGVKQGFDYLQLKDQIIGLENNIQDLTLGNNLLGQKVEQHKEDFYLEAEARSKFNLKKPGEKVVVIKNIPDFDNFESLETTVPKEISEKQKSNLVLWYKYFFVNNNKYD